MRIASAAMGNLSISLSTVMSNGVSGGAFLLVAAHVKQIGRVRRSAGR